MLNLEQLLKVHGHEVAVFAMDYPENLDTPWKKYFPRNMSKLMAFTRPFGDGEVKDKVLNNRVVKYMSGISMEIYLCHMMFYRVVSMIHLERFVGQCDMLYVVTCCGTLVGAICFSHVVKYYVFPFLEKKCPLFLGGFKEKT